MRLVSLDARRLVAALMAAFAVAGCSGGDGGDGGTNPDPAVDLALSAATLSVVQGASGTVTATVTRSGGFAGAVNVSVDGSPTGVTVTPAPAAIPSNQNTSVITVAVGATTAPGNYTLTVRASGTGVTQESATLALTVTAAPASSYALTVNPTTVTAQQGQNGTTTINITRTNFTAGITLSVDNLPAGVTASFNPANPVTANASSLTLAVGAAAAPGNYNLTVKGTATGQADKTAALTLTVTAAPTGGFTLSLNPATVTVQQGQNATTTVNIARTAPFAGPVNLTASGAPTGVTAAFDPAGVVGNTSTLTLTAAANATVGNHTITVRGTGTGVAEQTVTLNVQVTQAPSSPGNTSFAFCGAAATIPIWFAYQDGTGAWARVTPGANNTYAFAITQSRGGVAYVMPGTGGAFTMALFYGTQAELNAQGTTTCTSPTVKTINGSVANVGAQETAYIALGDATAVVSGAAGNLGFTLNSVADGPRDLIASRVAQTINGTSASSVLNKLIIRRNQNPAAGGTLDVLDFGSAEAFDPVARNVAVNGLNGDQAAVIASYFTATSFTGALFFNDPFGSGATRTYYGVPTARQNASDLHMLAVSAFPLTATGSRTILTFFKDAVDKTVTIGPQLNTPTVSVVASAPYVRLRAQLNTQTEYNKSFAAMYAQASAGAARTVIITATGGYVGAGPLDLTIPDFTGVAGWDSNWGLEAGAETTWIVTASGWAGSGGVATSPIVEGGVLQSASRMGTITP